MVDITYDELVAYLRVGRCCVCGAVTRKVCGRCGQRVCDNCWHVPDGNELEDLNVCCRGTTQS